MGGFVYIMASARNGTLYTGVTSDLAKRVYEHRESVVPGFTRRHGCKTLVWFEPHDDIQEARRRELQIKEWQRGWKLKLIERTNPDWLDLYDGLFGDGSYPGEGRGAGRNAHTSIDAVGQVETPCPGPRPSPGYSPLMSRLAAAFLRPQPRLIPFVMAGDPDLAATEAIVLALAEAGCAAIELGVPFSDPVADGPVIQAAAERARASWTHLSDVLALAARIRARSEIPLVLFSYFNPIHRHGHERFADDAARAGIDGVLCVDLPAEEAAQLADPLRARGLDPIFLVAPTTSDARLARISAQGSGFLYAVARAGVTGAGGGAPSDAARTLVARARALTHLPVAVGFGVSTAEQVREVSAYADAAVVGSALVAHLAEQSAAGADAPALAEAGRAFAAALLDAPFPTPPPAD